MTIVGQYRWMYEHEKSTPLELGLGWAVKLKKEFIFGQNALIEELMNGLKWNTVSESNQWNLVPNDNKFRHC